MKVIKMHLIDIAIIALGCIASMGSTFIIGEYFMIVIIITFIISILFKIINLKKLIVQKSSDETYKTVVIALIIPFQIIMVIFIAITI